MAAIFPKSANGGESEKFKLKKPMTVVKLVRKTGCVFTRKLSMIASCFVFSSFANQTQDWLVVIKADT